MDDEKMLRLSREVLQHHYGTSKYDLTGKKIDGLCCWTCGTIAEPVDWPCPPALLAQEVQVQVLSR
jgi:hypothetical protein